MTGTAITKPPEQDFFGAPIVLSTMDETVRLIKQRIAAGEFTQHGVVNVAKLVSMQSNAGLREAVRSCDIVNADGQGIVWGARLLGVRVPERVAGIDLFVRLLGEAESEEYPVYFLGAKDDVLDTMLGVVRAQFPGLVVAGSHHGYFWEDEAAVVEDIRGSGARLLFVGITSPLKEQFIDRWRTDLGVKFAMGVGGSFDVLAGKTRRAPDALQRVGLEWLFRLLQEPRRMWRRYLVTNTLFGLMLVRALLRRSTRSSRR